MKRSNVVSLKKHVERTKETHKDQWYSPYELPNGKIIYGAAAMNSRVQQAGGLQNLLNTYAEGFFNSFTNNANRA
jgi:hypothetical protein